MRKLSLWVFLISCSLLLLSACQMVHSQGAETLLPIETQLPGIGQQEKTEVPVSISTDSLVPTLDVDEEDPLTEDEFDCAETICLWPWEGWFERPIGLGGNRAIDPSYPYASTGNGTLDLHHGVEFLNPYGTPVLAAQDGEVVFAAFDSSTKIGPFLSFYGNVVILRHAGLLSENQDVYTLYAHLSEIDVTIGDWVTAGEKLGEVGSSGAAIGPHLHFEVRVGLNDYDHTVNPMLWFAPLDEPDYPSSAMLTGVILDRDGNQVPDLPFVLEKLTEFGTKEAYFYPKTYTAASVNSHPLLEESFVAPDLPPGEYRLAFVYDLLYEFFFTLEPGSLGFITFQLD